MLRPRAIAVKPAEDYTILVSFDNGEEKLFDVKPYISGSWYGQLEKPSVFNRVRIGGISVEWPDGQDIAPDELYDKSIRK